MQPKVLQRVGVRNAAVLKHLAGEGVAVCVKAARREAEYGVSGSHIIPGNDFSTFSGSHAGPDHVEVSFTVEARHLRRLAADEGYAQFLAGSRRAANHLGDGFGVEAAAGYVVEEKERTGTGG